MVDRTCVTWKTLVIVGLGLALAAFEATPALAQVSVPTYHNDNARTGVIQEIELTPANVHPSTFGKLFSHAVNGYVYAQPLYVPNVSIPGKGTHNVIYVATEHDTVYAFDADDATGGNARPLWKRRFINPSAGIIPVPSGDTICRDLVPEVGITGTPVIDVSTGTLYVVARTRNGARYLQRLHALDIATGLEKLGGPVTITASVPGSGDGSRNGMIGFDPLKENQRAALLLDHGRVYIAWAAHCDRGPSHGWVMAYDAATLAQLAVFNATPDGALGGIWQSGGGLAADAAGDVYVATGNGTFDADIGGPDYGNSVVKLRGSTLAVTDFFTPYNQAALSAVDADLGSGGTLLLPDQPGPVAHLLVTASKAGGIYLINRDSLGHFNPIDDSQIVQSIPHAFKASFGTPAIWNDVLYYQGFDDALKAFQLSGGRLTTTPTSLSGRSFGYPGSTPTISANGLMDAIAWVIERDTSTARPRAVLHAYDAGDLSVELYSSMQMTRRDSIGGAVKFTVPTVANGKVYVGARKRISVFGLL